MKNYRFFLLLSGLLPAAQASADTPAFDRPGIAFSTQTLPQGSFALEQGLPDVEHDALDGTHSTLYSADTTLRVGLLDKLEVQASAAPFNYLRTDAGGSSSHVTGRGDTGLALKMALPSSAPDFSWALLAGHTFANGATDFSAGVAQTDLATTLNFALAGERATALYFDVNRSGGANTCSFSPSLSLPINERTGSFVEAGASYAGHRLDSAVAGGGLTWMATPIVQLDAFADLGLTHASPALQAGIGISVFIR